jgi:hypothetical protein
MERGDSILPRQQQCRRRNYDRFSPKATAQIQSWQENESKAHSGRETEEKEMHTPQSPSLNLRT